MKSSKVLIIAMLSAVLTAGCARTPPAPRQPAVSPEPKVTLGATLEPSSLDLTASSQAAIPEVLLYNVLEGLVRIDNEGQIEPLLASSYDVSEDGKVYTFELREANFHNGTPMTANDVLFTFNRHRAPESTHPFKAQFAPIENVEAVDERTVRVTLKEFSANWLFNMALGAGVILSEQTIGQIAENPVGTGPFKFDSWTRGDNIGLVRNEDYWGTRAPLEEVVFKYIPDPSAMNNALLAGDIDIISRVTAPELLDTLKADPRFEVVEGLTNGEVIMAMNNTKGPLSDVRVRKAITHAIDRPGLIEAAYGGYGALIGSHVPPSDPWYIDLTDEVPYDPERAKDLLAEAGFADGFELSLQLPPPSYARRSGDIIASQLGEVGIRVNIENIEFPQWLERVFRGGNFDLSIVAHVEPRDISQYGNAQYYWHYDNPEVRQLLADADKQPDEEQRNDLYAQVQRKITADAVNVWLFLLPEITVMQKGISGYKQNRISFSIDMTEVVYEKEAA
ncbi:MAG: ABC transporter substrate-binding protein [Actinobacteria bacterium]|nr:ABC transporter substrate-binding protein [Actinomycetota bacterium]